jgi:hypothetical protein
MSYVDFCEARGLAENALESFSRYRAATQDVVPGRSLKFKPDH